MVTKLFQAPKIVVKELSLLVLHHLELTRPGILLRRTEVARLARNRNSVTFKIEFA